MNIVSRPQRADKSVSRARHVRCNTPALAGELREMTFRFPDGSERRALVMRRPRRAEIQKVTPSLGHAKRMMREGTAKGWHPDAVAFYAREVARAEAEAGRLTARLFAPAPRPPTRTRSTRRRARSAAARPLAAASDDPAPGPSPRRDYAVEVSK